MATRIRMPAGNLIGGLVYSQIQNSKTACEYQTKLRIPFLYEKMGRWEDLWEEEASRQGVFINDGKMK
jgi:hypothetical protein